jgi:DNA mismatch endonuclease, patch repair protein
MTPAQRSAAMAQIRGKNTGPEKLVRRALWAAGLRFRLHERSLPGKPDIVLKKWGAVVLIHGCFWHRHIGCRLFRFPATRTDFWEPKLQRNALRDADQITKLVGLGWRVLIVWECAIRFDPIHTEARILTWIRTNQLSAQLSARAGTLTETPLEHAEETNRASTRLVSTPETNG